MSSSLCLVEPLVSITSATVKGFSTEAKYATCCSTPSSQRRKFSLRRLGIYLPSRSMTLTGILTRVVLTLITSPASTSSGPVGCCGVEGTDVRLPVFAPPSTGGRREVSGTGVRAAGGWVLVFDPTRRGRVWALAVCARTAQRQTSRNKTEIFLMSRLRWISNQGEVFRCGALRRKNAPYNKL